jgi:aminoglycoside 3-N-acetyltransferase
MIIDLAEGWRRSGIAEGDTILIHSNIKRTLSMQRSIDSSVNPCNILESLIEALGPNGTLLLPLFNFEFTQGTPFDIRSSKSHMGALTEAGRTHPGSVRTGHPIYSFAAIGAKAHLFAGVDNKSAYAKDSPFGILTELGGKIGVLDLEDQHSMTFYHHVEEMLQVDYRYFKSFSGDYTDASGIKSQRSYELYVRDIDKGVKTDVNPAGELLWAEGLYTGHRPNQDTGMRVINAQDMFRFVENLIRSNRANGTLYSIES